MANERSLYELGWRQGTVIGTPLPSFSIAADSEGNAETRKDVHDTWLVATQDCNLARAKERTNSATIELRQVLDESPPDTWGIRARKFLLDEERGHYLLDDKPTTYVSPRYLARLDSGTLVYRLPETRVPALKTWLGNRYDRPAVPEDLIPLAKEIAQAIHDGDRLLARSVRDVYMNFDTSGPETIYSLYAITTDDADSTAVREWLADATTRIDSTLGVPLELMAGNASEVSFDLVESSYCADLSQITWGDNAEADGAA